MGENLVDCQNNSIVIIDYLEREAQASLFCTNDEKLGLFCLMDFCDSTKRDMDEIVTELQNIQRKMK